jgi:hypothetical protein
LLPRRTNSEAQNFDFDVKKQKYFSSAKGVASFALTSQVPKEKDWLPLWYPIAEPNYWTL